MLMDVELAHVEAFLAIVRSGGFSRAAAGLHLSQPAISRRVQLLEGELGAPLFERMRTGVILTDAGHAFLPHAEALVASMRDGLEAVAALRGTSRGTVTLAVVGTLASSTLTEHLRRFRDAYPAVDVRIRTALSAEVSGLVRRGDATLGLRYGLDPHPELVCAIVHHEPMVPVCSAQHRFGHAPRVAPEALAGERWITFPPRPGAGREPYATALEHGLAVCGLSAAETIPIDSLTAQKRMVEAGFGLALLPASSVDEETRAGTLCALRITGMRATLPVVLLQRRRAFQSGALQALAALLADSSSWSSSSSSSRGSGRGRVLER